MFLILIIIYLDFSHMLDKYIVNVDYISFCLHNLELYFMLSI
jgi:hypothetical protein